MFKTVTLLFLFTFPVMLQAQESKRARDYGVKIGVMQTGQLNAITDVAGVKVGQTTLIKGDSIRTGVTAILPNIAWFTRYEVVHETLRLYYGELKKAGALPIDKNLIKQLNTILKEEGDKVVFLHTRDEIKFKLQELGTLIDKLLNTTSLPQSQSYQTLCRVFIQQYRIDENELLITRDKEEITSDTIQSPHDIDSHYRNKDGNQVRGYSINLTESCDKEELHLISHVDVRPVSAADNNFLEDGRKAITGNIYR